MSSPKSEAQMMRSPNEARRNELNEGAVDPNSRADAVSLITAAAASDGVFLIFIQLATPLMIGDATEATQDDPRAVIIGPGRVSIIGRGSAVSNNGPDAAAVDARGGRMTA